MSLRVRAAGWLRAWPAPISSQSLGGFPNQPSDACVDSRVCWAWLLLGSPCCARMPAVDAQVCLDDGTFSATRAAAAAVQLTARLIRLPLRLQVCTADGTCMDIVNAVPYIQKFKKHPVSGAPLALADLIRSVHSLFGFCAPVVVAWLGTGERGR